jgi:hypothetical protein
MTTSTPRPATGELPERPRSAATWYDVLDVARDADTATIQQAYEHAIALIEGRHLGAYFVLDPTATAAARRDIEAAWAILADDERRHAYDRSLIGDDTDGPLTLPRAPSTTTPSTTPPSTPPETARPSALPTSQTPRAALRFLAPVDSTPAAGSPLVKDVPEPKATTTTMTEPTTTLRPSPHAGSSKEISSPGRSVGGIAFAPPSTDVGETPRATTVTTTAPTTTTMPPTTLPPTTLPPMDATLPPLTLPPQAPRRVEVPATATPTPPPGLMNLDGEVNGQTMRRLREFRGLSLDELAEATKIRRPYLAAIEAQDFENLPSRVYLRGFLTQIARVLRVDKNRLADGYLAFIARFG